MSPMPRRWRSPPHVTATPAAARDARFAFGTGKLGDLAHVRQRHRAGDGVARHRLRMGDAAVPTGGDPLRRGDGDRGGGLAVNLPTTRVSGRSSSRSSRPRSSPSRPQSAERLLACWRCATSILAIAGSVAAWAYGGPGSIGHRHRRYWGDADWAWRLIRDSGAVLLDASIHSASSRRDPGARLEQGQDRIADLPSLARGPAIMAPSSRWCRTSRGSGRGLQGAAAGRRRPSRPPHGSRRDRRCRWHLARGKGRP